MQNSAESRFFLEIPQSFARFSNEKSLREVYKERTDSGAKIVGLL
jgi:hypothetical protein